ncbi:AEC family transporter [Melaminivora sp.]|uniref:AEC family transporter n=1 Tax=Melaminivora sp. TaxID=1933032 RepID=UPI0028AD48E1|nr:AEC family transporter [Melaminivora sp.]
MLSVLSVTFPFFALVLAGYAATRLGLLPLPAIAGLNSFVLYFALPCMLYRFGAQTPIAQLLDPVVAGVYLFSGLVMALGTTFATRARWGWNDAAFGALVAAFPNSGFMGVPLLVALLGQASAGTVIPTMALDMIVTSSLCIALSRLSLGGGSAARALRLALRGVLANPLPWSIALGAMASAASLSLPAPLEQTVAMLAAAASPVALFAIGAVLARSQMNHAERVAPRDYVPVALAKLLLHPLLVWLACQVALLLGLELAPLAVTTLVLVAALPSASNVSLLAERFGAHGGRVARIILVSTGLAFVTFSGAVVWVG